MFSEILHYYREALELHRREVALEEDPIKKSKILKEWSERKVQIIQELVELAEEKDIPIVEQAANWIAEGDSLYLLLSQQISLKFGKEPIRVEKVECCPKCGMRLVNDELHKC